jgi:hypothetical protein
MEVHTVMYTFRHQLLLTFFPLPLEPIALLQPAFGRRGINTIFLERIEELAHAGDLTRLALFWSMIGWRNVAESWTRCEEGQQVGWELVRHFGSGVAELISGVMKESSQSVSGNREPKVEDTAGWA